MCILSPAGQLEPRDKERATQTQRRLEVNRGNGRNIRAEKFVQLGEISAGRQALESARVAPGTLVTLHALTNRQRHPPVPREPVPEGLATAMPESPFDLDFDRFISNIRRAKRGAAPGPSGMTTEHFHPILENDASLIALFHVAVLFSRGQVPPNALEGLRLGRITALAKPDGGVRGIVIGDVFRRIVARTTAQQIGDQVAKATAPYQFALKTRAGCECVSHTLRTLAEMDEATTILSVDGVGAFDLISRGAMMRGLVDMPDGAKVLPFVRMFPQGEGGEQGDPLMPLLFSLGQHGALMSVAAELRRGEHIFAFLDDLYVTAQPDRVVDIHHSLATHLWNQASITLHQGKTAIWNQGGIYPRGCHALEEAARREDPTAVVWRGNVLLEPHIQGLVVLGVPVGRPEYTLAMLEAKSRTHNVLLDRITSVADLQSAWCLLLYCAAARANFWLRTVHPELSGDFAREHDASLWRCMCQLLHINPCHNRRLRQSVRFSSTGSWRVGFAFSRATPPRSPLGQLGRHDEDLHSRVPSVATNFIASFGGGRGHTKHPVSSQLCRQSCWSWIRGPFVGGFGCRSTS